MTTDTTAATLATIADASLDTLRAAYARCRDAGRYAAGKDWDRAVLACLPCHPIDATPQDWLDAAERATVTCEKCHGTGIYCWGGTINGIPVHTGDCVRCQGRGRQDQDDMHRNRMYDRHAIRKACGF